jgi:hypothetical protein
MTADEMNGPTGPPRYPHVEVQLAGTDGNAFAVLAGRRPQL